MRARISSLLAEKSPLALLMAIGSFPQVCVNWATFHARHSVENSWERRLPAGLIRARAQVCRQDAGAPRASFCFSFIGVSHLGVLIASVHKP
ncbi:MAG: hypothetical protein HY232_06570 [Acidobacteria bacterium]|nr:hypothetical protein [Acidobacteriota bacterium]